MDAVRIADDEMVVFKRISLRTHPYELEISKMFSSEPLKSHPRNHCVPILEVLPLPNTSDEFLLVEPLLRDLDDPWFETIGELMEFLRQIFEVSYV